MKKLIFFLTLISFLSSEARLRNCNNCYGGCDINQTCCFVVDCPEKCNPYTCNPYCSNVSDPKCVFDSSTGKYLCICR